MEWSFISFFEEEDMNQNKFIGIDPDSQSFVCAFIDRIDPNKKEHQKFMMNRQGFMQFEKWYNKCNSPVVAIEGINGQSKPLEIFFRKTGIVFYSFNPSDVFYYRRAVLGQNKTNELDAEATAGYAMMLLDQNRLDLFRRIWFPDTRLQRLTREHTRTTKFRTENINAMWKELKSVDCDLYQYLQGTHPIYSKTGNILKNKGILRLISKLPNISDWPSLSFAEYKQVTKTHDIPNSRYAHATLVEIAKQMTTSGSADTPVSFVLKNMAERILLLTTQIEELNKIISTVVKGNLFVEKLTEYAGISNTIAAKIVAEIIDIRRFPNDDHLASYSGLGMRSHSTGDGHTMVKSYAYNHRLKDALMQAVKEIVVHNPDLHLTGYFRSLRKDGKIYCEAIKRTSRGFCRKLFKAFREITEQEFKKEKVEAEVAKDSIRSCGKHHGNTTASTQLNSSPKKVTKKEKSACFS